MGGHGVGHDPAAAADAQATLPGSYVRLVVEDTGSGMDLATPRRAVEPFFSTKGVGQGTGLGLSMVHGLAAQSGGRFHLSSEPGRDTGMTGAELAAEMQGRVPGLSVVMITGYANLPPEKTRGLMVLSKPFRQAELATTLARLLDVARPSPAHCPLAVPRPPSGAQEA